MSHAQFEHADFPLSLIEGKTAAETHVLYGVAATPQIHIGEKFGEERIMLALDLLVGPRLLTPPVGADDGDLREKVIGVDVIKVRMGIDQEADQLVRHPTDFSQQILGHGGIGQAVDHDHVPVSMMTPALL